MKTINPSTALRVNSERSRTIKFLTLGCKANQYDTQNIREQFLALGYKEIGRGKIADACLINTCTVTHRADCDSLNLIRRARRENPKAKIIVTGCLTELDSARIKEIEGIDLIVKNKDKIKIFKLLNGITNFAGHTRAFLKIQDGCDNFCSYCKVPLVRGRSKSRPLKEIVAEARALSENGFKEIVLTGICLGAYGRDLKKKISLLDVINALEKIPNLVRIRLSSIEAGDISNELIEKIISSSKLCRHLHIPLQSGDDEILKQMNRKYASRDFIRLIKKIKSRIPGIAITTDVLVGFPGENEENFKNTIKVIRAIVPLKTHIFPYSRREGTSAVKISAEQDPKTIKERIARLNKISDDCALKFKKGFLNTCMDVLIESASKKEADLWEGYTDNYIKVLFKSRLKLKNQFIALKLKKINSDSVLAVLN